MSTKTHRGWAVGPALDACYCATSALVPRNPPTIDVNSFTSDERRELQKENSVNDVAHIAHSAKWMTRRFGNIALWVVHRRLDHARRNGIDPNTT